ncbi:MAG: flagellar type III secretion system pore protein FliP [Firmicutes bacterium]|nr:flagellar type III secretion system pore protein FliP [Bacillota bacterium]
MKQRMIGQMTGNKPKCKLIAIVICLLVTVGILCIQNSITVQASGLTGDSEQSTILNQPGTAETPDELNSLNTGNTFTLTLNEGNGELNGALRIFLILTLISLAPTIIMMMTSFTRIIIVLHFTRAALNTQTAPPNQILIGLALILTFFIMEPTITQINEQAIKPYEAGELTQEEALEAGVAPLREFMYPQTQVKDVQLFMDIAGQEWDGQNASIPLSVLLPSFMLSELRIAFWIGFMIYIPFIVIDMVVASTLMSMGMMMLPPTTISMPFKILLFVLADGWGLVIGNLVKTFY